KLSLEPLCLSDVKFPEISKTSVALEAMQGSCDSFDAHSGDCDRPFRPKVITGSGDHDHAVRPPRGPA
ncbi:MAG TPA: hypothetical protein VGF39_01495, partial [Stellaceae bacterium]